MSVPRRCVVGVMGVVCPGPEAGGARLRALAGRRARPLSCPRPLPVSGSAPRFRTVLLDVDSTLAGVEGIDWLAARRGAAVAAAVAEMTERAMRGEVALDAVYGERLALVRPGRDDLAALARAYTEALAPGAAAALARMRAAGVRLALVSGGVRQAILPAARALGFAAADVHAVDVVLDPGGGYVGYDAGSPLATQGGKGAVARALLGRALGASADTLGAALPAPALAVGDGSTDLALRGPGACEALAAFTGFARRAVVVAAADFDVESFDALAALVLGEPPLRDAPPS